MGILEVAPKLQNVQRRNSDLGSYNFYELFFFLLSDIPQYSDVKLKSTDKTVGSLRAVSGYRGIALLRVNDVLKQPSELYTTDSDGNTVDVRTHRPKWWPDGVGVL